MVSKLGIPFVRSAISQWKQRDKPALVKEQYIQNKHLARCNYINLDLHKLKWKDRTKDEGENGMTGPCCNTVVT